LHLSNTLDPSSPLRGGSEVEKNCKYLPYVRIWSAAQTELVTKTKRVGWGACRSASYPSILRMASALFPKRRQISTGLCGVTSLKTW
jgi:hypothetical protein